MRRAEDVPDNLWDKCPSCEQMIFHRELEAASRRLPAIAAITCASAVRRGSSSCSTTASYRADRAAQGARPTRCSFRDSKRYTDRLQEAQAKTGAQDAVVVAQGRIGGVPAVVAAFDFAFMGGSMGVAVGEALLAAAAPRRAAGGAADRRPGLGRRAHAGGHPLADADAAHASSPSTMVKEAGLPYIVVLTDPTTGGVTASFAMLGDITIAEPGAVIGFAGARVIEETIREKLPEGFQRAEYLLEHGMVDMVVPRGELRDTLARVIDLLRHPAPPAERRACPGAAGEPHAQPERRARGRDREQRPRATGSSSG